MAEVDNNKTAELEDIAPVVTFLRRVIEATWLVVVFLVPLFFNPLANNIFELNKVFLFRFLVLVMLAFWLAEGMLLGIKGDLAWWKRLLAAPLRLSVLIFALALVVSTAASVMPGISFWGSYVRGGGMYTLLCFVFFFLVVAYHLRTKAQLQRLIYVALISAWVASIYGIIQYLDKDPFFNVLSFRQRVVGTTGNAIFLSAYLLMLIPLNLALLLKAWFSWRQGRGHWLWLVALSLLLGLQLTACWLTESRGPFLGLVLGLITFAILFSWKERRKLWLRGSIIAGVVVVVVSGLLFWWASLPQAYPGLADQLPSSSRVVSLAQLRSEGPQSRWLMWQAAAKLIVQHPSVGLTGDNISWLRPVVGYGAETQEATFAAVYPPKIAPIEGYSTIIDRAHNRFLDLAVTTGLFGLAGFMFMVVAFFYYAWCWLRVAESRADQLLLVALIASMLGSLVEGFFGIDAIEVELGFWLDMVLLAALGTLMLNPREGSASIPAEVELNNLSGKQGGVRKAMALSCIFILVLFGSYSTINPFRADMEARQGLELAGGDSVKGSIAAFDRATALAPDTAIYYNFLAQMYFKTAQGVADQANKEVLIKASAAALKRARELEPLFVRHYSTSGMVYTYWAGVDPQKWPETFNFYEQAVKLSPNQAYLYNEWALALVKKGDFDQARAKLEISLSIDPGYPLTHYLLGVWLTDRGELAEALSEFTAGIRGDIGLLTSFDGFVASLADTGRLPELQAAMVDFVKQAPEDWVGHQELAIINFRQGKPDDGAIETAKALELVPQDKLERLQRLLPSLIKKQ